MGRAGCRFVWTRAGLARAVAGRSRLDFPRDFPRSRETMLPDEGKILLLEFEGECEPSREAATALALGARPTCSRSARVRSRPSASGLEGQRGQRLRISHPHRHAMHHDVFPLGFESLHARRSVQGLAVCGLRPTCASGQNARHAPLREGPTPGHVAKSSPWVEGAAPVRRAIA